MGAKSIPHPFPQGKNRQLGWGSYPDSHRPRKASQKTTISFLTGCTPNPGSTLGSPMIPWNRKSGISVLRCLMPLCTRRSTADLNTDPAPERPSLRAAPQNAHRRVWVLWEN